MDERGTVRNAHGYYGNVEEGPARIEKEFGTGVNRSAQSRRKAHEDLQMVIHDGEPAACDGEDIRKFLQPKFDSFPTVERSFGEKERPADTASDAVIPARHGDFDELGARHRRE